MRVHFITLIVCALDAIGWILFVVGYLASQSDQATAGLDYAALVLATGLFVLTAVPAFVLVLLRRSEKTALGLSLAFPATLVILLIGAVLALA
jgi:hypothetical protein